MEGAREDTLEVRLEVWLEARRLVEVVAMHVVAMHVAVWDPAVVLVAWLWAMCDRTGVSTGTVSRCRVAPA